MAQRQFIPNQTFVGLPFKGFKDKYEKSIKKLSQKYPISLVIVGNDGSQKAEDLLELIKKHLYQSSEAIFDVTGGNPNVALEFGLAHAKDIPCIVYLSRHKAHQKANVIPIIADLSGMRRREYKTEKGLYTLLKDFCAQHAFSKRFESAFRKQTGRLTKGQKKSQRTLWLRIIHKLDQKDQLRRDNVKQDLLADGYSDEEIEKALKSLHAGKIVNSSSGRYSDVSVV